MNNIRINAVTLRLLNESIASYTKFFPEQETCSGEQIVKGYIRSIYSKKIESLLRYNFCSIASISSLIHPDQIFHSCQWLFLKQTV
ncbi:hypothetical protein Xhom_01783 [Xenorhabdus hominickii]|uniref:Uncharacterized protein n=1 Tax=Xenorhabdus hominickii TaxID=351679 RepID=A0A2G0QAM8_XENHO|nr:hypothetical protein Xhom_01783 [Xenorhabdus hominickii]